MIELVTYTDNFERVVLKTVDYKKVSTLEAHLEEECNKMFGVGKWRKVENHSNGLDNLTGWYGVDSDGLTIGYETKPVGW
jgi:hypothetical protein